ncbi:MAG: hypothetical protein MJ016_01785 [Victivallaceae bacterium]|nr:hypothetical protein [Victivallaceae bacterium]
MKRFLIVAAGLTAVAAFAGHCHGNDGVCLAADVIGVVGYGLDTVAPRTAAVMQPVVAPVPMSVPVGPPLVAAPATTSVLVTPPVLTPGVVAAPAVFAPYRPCCGYHPRGYWHHHHPYRPCRGGRPCRR